MKKKIKIIIIIISIIIGFIVLDTITAIILKKSPALSLRNYLIDDDSYVDKGILINTYYCTKEEDIVTISHHSKSSKFTCPIDNKNELNEVSGVWMKIKKGTLTNTSTTVIITDLSGKNNTYGEEYRIDKLENKEWKELPVVVKGNYGWNSIGYHVGKDHKLELEINWEWLYGKLDEGTYRIVKGTSNNHNLKEKYFSVEFTID